MSVHQAPNTIFFPGDGWGCGGGWEVKGAKMQSECGFKACHFKACLHSTGDARIESQTKYLGWNAVNA